MNTKMDFTLITGASGGIGAALAREFASRQHPLILVARRQAEMEDLAAELRQSHGIEVVVMPCDLSQPRQVDNLLAGLSRQGLAVDILVNNAGFSAAGEYLHTKAQWQEEMLAVNLAALNRLTRALLPHMVRRGRGGVINLASTGSFVAGPNNALYCASKAFVLSFTEALHHELKGSGVTATALCPGATDTGFAARAGLQNTPIFRGPLLTSQQVARAGLRAFLGKKSKVVVGLGNRLLVLLLRFTPRQMATAISGRLTRHEVFRNQGSIMRHRGGV